MNKGALKKHMIYAIQRIDVKLPAFIAALCANCIPRYINAGYTLNPCNNAKAILNDPRWCWCCKKDTEGRL